MEHPTTVRGPVQRLYSALQTTDASFATVSLDDPGEGNGRITTLNNAIKLTGYGEGDEGEVFSFAAVGYHQIISPETGELEWVTGDLLEGVMTLGAKTATIDGQTVRLAKTIAATADKGLGDEAALLVESEAGQSGVAWIGFEALDWEVVRVIGHRGDGVGTKCDSFNFLARSY